MVVARDLGVGLGLNAVLATDVPRGRGDELTKRAEGTYLTNSCDSLQLYMVATTTS
jgi:hypothetical protein